LGWDYAGPFLASAELYDPKAGAFAATGSMSDKRVSHSATLLANGWVLITGGFDRYMDTPTAALFDPQTGTFGQLGPAR
jgi:hypothetical protein